MAQVVFILGAGASAECGCPCMADFFKRADMIGFHNEFDEFDDAWREVNAFRRFAESLAVHSGIDHTNLETLLNTLEMAEFVKASTLRPDLSPEFFRSARRSLLRLIVATLERSQECGSPIHLSGHELLPITRHAWTRQGVYDQHTPAGYEELSLLVRWLLQTPPIRRVAFISFNYDLGLEFALQFRELEYDYCLEDHTSSKSQLIPLLKLHGSTNWIETDAGVKAIGYPNASWLKTRRVRRADARLGHDSKFLMVSPKLSEYARQHGTDAVPLIVPPSENKASQRPTLQRIWKRAAEEISEAEYVAIAGYSMPATDEFFKQLWTISASPRGGLRKVFLACRRDSAVVARFKQLLGPTANARGLLDADFDCFSNLVTKLADNLRTSGGFLEG